MGGRNGTPHPGFVCVCVGSTFQNFRLIKGLGCDIPVIYQLRIGSWSFDIRLDLTGKVDSVIVGAWVGRLAWPSIKESHYADNV